jgi:hypothetical protein
MACVEMLGPAVEERVSAGYETAAGPLIRVRE